MPCYFPLQATFVLRPDGKKDLKFSNAGAKLFKEGVKPSGDDNLSIPCGQCMGCRLERSRQWAVRMVHEAQMYDDNCFVTLTFSPEGLKECCPLGSLDKKHMQDFMKRLRQQFSDRKIRVFYCGEYGDKFDRPHYHLCLFNCDFYDQVYWQTVGDFKYYRSSILEKLWPFGNSSITSFSFETGAYVARYCTKKVNGKLAKEHYGDRLPEFAQMSLKPGIGRAWFDKYGMSDIFPLDECVSRGVICKPPRYYDSICEKTFPELFAHVKSVRRARGLLKADDNSARRLAVKERCLAARMKSLVRKLEVSVD